MKNPRGSNYSFSLGAGYWNISTQPDLKNIHPKYDRFSDRKCSKKYKLLTSNHTITMKIYGLRLGACFFGTFSVRITIVFWVYVFQVRLGYSKIRYRLGWVDPLNPNTCGLGLKNWVFWWSFWIFRLKFQL